MPQALPYLYIAAAAATAGAAIHQGEVQSNYGKYQRDQAQADADAQRAAAQVEAERIRKAGKQQRAEAIAALAASGVNVDSATAVKIDQEITHNSEADAYLTIVGGNDKAARLNAQGQGAYLRGQQGKMAGYVNATSSLLEGASGAARGWKRPAATGTGG
jgi:hypothetical protein